MIMTIKRKLFVLSVLPTITILLFSINHIFDKYEKLRNKRYLLTSTKLIDNTSHLLHELQFERGLSFSYLEKKNDYFRKLLENQRQKTDEKVDKFLYFLKSKNVNFLTNSNKLLLSDINEIIESLNETRQKINKHEVGSKRSFKYYTNLNTQLIELAQDIRLYSSNNEAEDKILVLKKFLQLSEFAGQERAKVISLNQHNLDTEDMFHFYYLLSTQQKELRDIYHLVQNTSLESKINAIANRYNKSYINKVREELKQKNLSEPINAKLWIEVTTKRINDFFELEHMIIDEVEANITTSIKETEYSLILQLVFTAIIIFIFLLGSYFVGMNIIRSLKELNNGIDNFFDFLNFKTKKAKKIEVKSHDEIFEMAEKINKQITRLELNIKNDKNFINEVTHIATLMKDGDFSEKLYFEPTNPNLIELKIVFNELVDLIVQKVKEQTKEVEMVNARLSDEVYFQTLDLEQKIKDLTHARDIAVEAERSKDDFLANMSHEIRTPLNAILGFVDILKKRINEPKSTSYLNIISNSGNSLLAIINDILDFSKIQSGKFNITPHEINIIQDLSNTTLLFASKAYEKNLIYAVYIDPNLPQIIRVDIVRVKQILSNLLSNSIKFTPRDGMVKVKILLEDDELIISVQDSGIGIAKENIDKVFSAFEQADGSTTRKYGGTGLGLSISAKLAQLMDGELTLVSTEGRGSTFTLRIPVEIVKAQPQEFFELKKVQKYKFAILNPQDESKIFTRLIKKYLSDLKITNIIELEHYTDEGYDILFFIPSDEYNEEIVEAEISAIAMLRSNQIKLADLKHITALYAPFAPTSVIQAIDDVTIEKIQEFSDERHEQNVEEDNDEEILFEGKILVAEDNKTNQMLIKLILMDFELEFEIANDGVEAVEMYKTGKYDLILMDENMPNLNGLGAMAQIKEYEDQNNLKHVPIIALTANALVSDIDRFLDAGMDGFVAKPIDTQQLIKELSRFLKRI
jgi:signal transduction histidine kinase/ActR/RegA family two-component response regulator